MKKTKLIRIDEEVRVALIKKKIVEEESYNSVIKRLLKKKVKR